MPEGWGAVDPAAFAVVAAIGLSAGLAVAALRPEAVVRNPRQVLVGLGLATLAAIAVQLRIDPPGTRHTIDPSTERLLPADDPGVEAYRLATLDFGDDQIFVVAMQCDDVFRSDHLNALRRVSDAVSRIDGVRSVKSLVRVTSFRYVPEDAWIEVRPFIERVPDAPAEIAELRRRALADPVYRRNLVSEDGRVAALNVSFRSMSDREFIAAGIDEQIAAILAGETEPGRRFFVSGRPHIKTRMYHTMTRDLAVLVPVCIGVVALVLALVAGTLRGVCLPVASLAAAIVWTFGAIALLELPLTVLTVLLAPTLIAIGSVYGVHVVNRYEDEVAAGGARDEVVVRTMRAMVVPVLIAGATTMVGFAALLISDVPAVFEIGAFSIFGVASVTLMSLTALPAALALLPLRPPERARRFGLASRIGARLEQVLTALARATSRRPSIFIGLWLLLTAVSIVAVPRIVIDTDYLSFFDRDAPVRVEFDAINRLLAGAIPLYVVLDTGEPGGLRDPAVLRRIEEIQRRIDAQPGVSRTLSFLEGLKLLNRAVEGGAPEHERIPDDRRAVSELLFMYPKSDLLRFATVDHRLANILVRTGEVGSAAMRDLTRRIEAVVGSGLGADDFDSVVTGNAVLLNRAADGVARSQPRTVGLAGLAIFLLLAVGLRSPRLGLVAMVPNAIPILIFFGLLGLGAAPLSLPTSLIGSVALGIAIDATAHYLVRYRAERTAGCSPEQAVLRTNRSVGRPVAIGALMLTFGFLSVSASEFATLRQFGLLSAFTMAMCAATDLVLLPALLVRWRL